MRGVQQVECPHPLPFQQSGWCPGQGGFGGHPERGAGGLGETYLDL